MKTALHFVCGLTLIGTLYALATGCDTEALQGANIDDADRGSPVERGTTLPRNPAAEWEFLGLGGEGFGSVTAVAVDPHNPDLILASTARNFSEGIEGRIWRSTDGGSSWTEVQRGGSTIEIHFHPTIPDLVFAIPHELIRSTDGGATWHDASDDVLFDYERRAQTFGFHPSIPDMFFLGTGGFGAGALYRSADGAETWEDLSTRPHCTGQPQQDPVCYLNDGAISLVYDSTGTLFAGTNLNALVLASDDDGDSWRFTSRNSIGLPRSLVADVFDHERIYAAFAFEGVWSWIDGGENWISFGEGLPDYSAGRMIQDTHDGTLFLLAGRSLKGSLFRRERGAALWEEWGIPGQQLGSSALHLTKRRLLYVGSSGLWRIHL